MLIAAGALLSGPAGFGPGEQSAEAALLSELKKLLASDAQDFDFFGASVAVSSETAVVEAVFEDAGQPAGDTDGDGCTDTQENGPNEALGGQRDYLNFWDFFDVPVGTPPKRDKMVNIIDIGGIVLRFGSASDPPPTKQEALAEAFTPPPDLTSYHAAFDRGGPNPGEDFWDLQGPDGSINIIEIGAAVIQFGHSCINSQGETVQGLIERSWFVRIACLDVNNDGRVDTEDADLKALVDITGDGVVDEADLEVILRTNISLPEGKPAGCAGARAGLTVTANLRWAKRTPDVRHYPHLV